MTDKTPNDDLSTPLEPAGLKPCFLDRQEARPVPLGNLRTEDETKPAAEIEKLRG
ncbi:MAG: hypothetical protein ABL956_18170 [Hyphomonadaceae bacterium]